MRAARVIGALVAVQVALVALYLAVEHLRVAPASFAVEALDEVAPALVVERPGAPREVPDQAHLVHFWATWCAPCQEELPGLLDAASATGVPVVAVTDEPWPVVERYFDDAVPEPIVRDPTGRAAAAWQVSGLPDTFVVRGGRVVGRMGGPRDWRTPAARDFLDSLRRTR